MEKQIVVVDEDTFNSALELIAENPVNIIAPWHSWFNVKDADVAIDIVGGLVAKGYQITVEIAEPKSGAEIDLHPSHHLVARTYKCPDCGAQTNNFDKFFIRDPQMVLTSHGEEYRVDWVKCKRCKWRGSEMAI
jgi:hypothetical protein